jgi:predicted nucleotidyltransferase
MNKEKYQKEIKKITLQIVEKYKPEKIILFGSFANGKPTKDSDLDLFIIKKTKKSPGRRLLEVEKILLNRKVPLDFLVFTPKEVEKRISLGDFFIRDITQKGKLVYEQK